MSQNSKPTSPVSRLGGMGQWIRPLVFPRYMMGNDEGTELLLQNVAQRYLEKRSKTKRKMQRRAISLQKQNIYGKFIL